MLTRQVNATILDPNGGRVPAGTPVHTDLMLDNGQPQAHVARVEEDGRLILRFENCALQAIGGNLQVWTKGGYWAGRFITPADQPREFDGLEGHWKIAAVMEYVGTIALLRSAQTPGPFNRDGVVRRVGKALTDARGLFHPLGMTFFWALYGWKFERDRVLQHLDWFAGKRIDFLRTLGAVGWTGETIDPTWPDYEELLAGYIDAAWDRGIRTQITHLGGREFDAMTLARRVVNVLPGREHKVIAHEVANEAYSIGVDESVLVQVAAYLGEQTPHLVGLSAPAGGKPAWDRMNAAAHSVGAALFPVHTGRDGADFKWKQVRQGWDFKDTDLVVSGQEPPGPGSSVDTNNSPLQLAMMRAVGVDSGGAIYVLHTGTTVYGRAHTHPSGGFRPANIWEVANIDAIVAAVRDIDTLLPEGVENWTKANTQWTTPNPVAPFQVNGHWPTSGSDGVNKAYAALSGQDFIQLPIGVRNCRLTASYPLTCTIYDPLTLQPLTGLENVSKEAGETIDLPGDPNYMAAYVIRGTRR